MADKPEDLIRLSVGNELTIVRYQKGKDTYVVTFDKPIRYNDGEKRRKAPFLKGVSKKQLEAICPNYDGEADIEVGDIFEYDRSITKGLINFSIKRREGYELTIMGVDDEKGYKLRFRPGINIKKKNPEVKTGIAHLTLDQIRGLYKPFSNGRVPKIGDVFVISRDDVREFIRKKNQTLEEKVASGSVNSVDDEIDPEIAKQIDDADLGGSQTNVAVVEED